MLVSDRVAKADPDTLEEAAEEGETEAEPLADNVSQPLFDTDAEELIVAVVEADAEDVIEESGDKVS